MKISEIKPGKKYYKLAADQSTRRRGAKMDKIVHSVYVLQVDERGPVVLASINGMPATWYNQAAYAKWTAEKPQGECL